MDKDGQEKEEFKGLLIETEKKYFETQKEYFSASLGLVRKTMMWERRRKK